MDQWAVDHPWQIALTWGVLFFIMDTLLTSRDSVMSGALFAVLLIPVVAWLWGGGPARTMALRRIARRSESF